MSAPVRVLVVDDQALFRRGLHRLLEVEDGLEVVGEAADGAQALEQLAAGGKSPDVALVDARMPVMDGITLIGELSERYPAVAAIVLTTFEDETFIFDGFRAGAKGHLLKDTPPEELVAAILRVSRGETVVGSAAAERMVAALAAALPPAQPQSSGTAEDEPCPDGAASSTDALSAREEEVARLVGAGASNAEIASTLCITEGTAKNHVTSALRKLGLRDRTRLALWVQDRSR